MSFADDLSSLKNTHQTGVVAQMLTTLGDKERHIFEEVLRRKNANFNPNVPAGKHNAKFDITNSQIADVAAKHGYDIRAAHVKAWRETNC